MIRASTTSKQKDAAVNPIPGYERKMSKTTALVTIGLCMFLVIALGLLAIIVTHIVDSGLAFHMIGKFSRIILAAVLTTAFFLFVWRCLSLCIDSSLQAVEVGRIRLDTVGGVLKLFLFLQIIFFVSVFCCLYAFPVTESQNGPSTFLKQTIRLEYDTRSVDHPNIIKQDNNIESLPNLLQHSFPVQKQTTMEDPRAQRYHDNNKDAEPAVAPIFLPAVTMETLAGTDLFPVRLRRATDSGDSIPNIAVPEDSRQRVMQVHVNLGATGGDFSLENLFSFTVDHPDLQYRSRDEIRSQFPLLFEELPLSGVANLAVARGPEYDKRFKNPCWVSRRAPRGAGAPINSDLTQVRINRLQNPSFFEMRCGKESAIKY